MLSFMFSYHFFVTIFTSPSITLCFFSDVQNVPFTICIYKIYTSANKFQISKTHFLKSDGFFIATLVLGVKQIASVLCITSAPLLFVCLWCRFPQIFHPSWLHFPNILWGLKMLSGHSEGLRGQCEWMQFNAKRLGGDLQITMLINLSLGLSQSPEKKPTFYCLGIKACA